MKKFTVLLLSLFISLCSYAQNVTLVDKVGNNIENKGTYASYHSVGASLSHYFYVNNLTDKELLLNFSAELDEANSTIVEGDADLSVCWGLCANPWMFTGLTEAVPVDGSTELKFDYNNPKKEGVTILNCKFTEFENPDVVVIEFTITFTVLNDAVAIIARGSRDFLENKGTFVTNQELNASVSHYFDVKNITNEEKVLMLSIEVDRENSTILEDDASLAVCWGACNMPWEFGRLVEVVTSGGFMEMKFDFNNPAKNGVTVLNCQFIDETTEAVVYEFTIKLTVGPQSIETPALNHLKAYPNPASTDFYVNHDFSSNVRNAQITLINILGVTVKEEQITNLTGTTHIDISALPAGIYFYAIKADGKVVETKKMIISR